MCTYYRNKYNNLIIQNNNNIDLFNKTQNENKLQNMKY